MADETGALSRVLELAEEPTAPAPTVAEAVDAAVVGEARPKPRAATQQGFLNAVVGMAYLWHAMDDEVDGHDQDQESSSMETVEIENLSLPWSSKPFTCYWTWRRSEGG